MILNLLLFFLGAAVWTAGFWLVARPDFSTWSTPALLALHALPPVVLLCAWIAVRSHAREKKLEKARDREAKAQAERDAAREAARRRHVEEMSQRHFACVCRAVIMTQIGAIAGAPVLLQGGPAGRAVDIAFQAHAAVQPVSGEPLLDHMAPAVAEALSKLYSSCAASMIFPIYVLPPSEVAGEEVLNLVRTIHAGLADKFADGIRIDGGLSSILFLPASDTSANSLISLFESVPDLPGAVVLAFDSPRTWTLPGDPFSEGVNGTEAYCSGEPSQGTVALLLTHAGLADMLKMMKDAGNGDGADSMTPFWERSMEPGGGRALLARLDTTRREQLAALPTLGRIHRGVVKHASSSRTGMLEMTRAARDVLERAQINAGLIDVPFIGDATSAGVATETGEAKPDSLSSRDIGGIVHNAGGVDTAGKRLAALGSAMYYFDIDLNPMDAELSINTPAWFGDLGRASGLAQIALGVVQASGKSTPVLCAEFDGEDCIAASVVMPEAVSSL